MSSLITAVFKATFGVLVNKARDKAAEKLREGDVTDKRIRDLIAREIDDIKSKLDGLARKDLLAAIDAFETGLSYCYQAMDAETGTKTTELTEPRQEINEQFDAVNAVALAGGIRNMELAELGEKAKTALSEGKKRFRMAREKATEASNNEALSTSDRVTAIQYRVMATMFESAAEVTGTARNSLSLKDVLENAMPECKKCLQKLHSLPDVQRNFKVELDKGLLNVKGRFGKDERRGIISAVCHVNRAIYDALEAAGDFTPLFDLLAVDTGEEKIDPLHDRRVAKVLEQVGMKQCCITPWSFGQEGKEEHKLKDPRGAATNADGQFIIADNGDKTVKVFDSSGHFIRKLSPYTDDDEKKLDDIFDVATDEDSNIYVLVVLVKTGDGWSQESRAVLVFNSTADQLCTFPVELRDISQRERLTVSKNKVLVLSTRVIDVHETDGGYVRSFGDEILKNARDITAGPDGRILVLDCYGQCIHVFTEDGQQLSKFSIRTKEAEYYRVACHPGGEHVIVAGTDRGTYSQLRVGIYTIDGECQRTMTLNQTLFLTGIRWIAVNMAGRILLSFVDEDLDGKVIVL